MKYERVDATEDIRKGDIVRGHFDIELSVGNKRLLMKDGRFEYDNHRATISSHDEGFRKTQKPKGLNKE